MTKRWYVVHTFSGYEDKAKQALLMRIKDKGQEDLFEEILIPSEKVVQIRNGKRREVVKKHFPGYMLVNMEFNKLTYHTVKDTPRVTGFVGGAHPPPVPDEEVARIMGRMEDGQEQPKSTVDFEKNENVRVIQGPFANFSGIVDEVLDGKSKLRVMVSIFGRATPVELDFSQVEKI
jgi:transcriptional antiterminator NusG